MDLFVTLISVDISDEEDIEGQVLLNDPACSLSPIGSPSISTDIKLSDAVVVDQMDQCQENSSNAIDLVSSPEVSIDLPSLEWTFLTEREIDIGEIGMDTNQQCIGTVPSESRDLSNLLFQIQFPHPINGWFVIPNSFQNSCIQLCTFSVNNAGSPVIEYTIEICCTLEWILRLPRGVLEWKCHPRLQALPVRIKSRKDIEEITHTISDCKQCKGIIDQKFHMLTVKHKGRFMDHCGKSYIFSVS